MKQISVLILGLLLLPAISQAQQPASGRVRALKQRAETVVKQKNSFVVMVLTAYNIPYQVNDQGVVTRIQVRDQWQDVTAIEIVPLVDRETDSGAPSRIRGHQLYFFTVDGILDLFSDLTIH
ncbi:MAG: hypothetical protein SWH61_17825 [Thermodesulfobacteriota bacterium]|nr:hypothetical protein [Thermodesulfobacteriota bacterium]